MICLMSILAFIRACALCCWMVTATHHVNTVPQFFVHSCCCPVPSASLWAARAKLVKAVWYPKHRCFLCMWTGVVLQICCVFLLTLKESLHVNLKAEPGSRSPDWHLQYRSLWVCPACTDCAELGIVTLGWKIKLILIYSEDWVNWNISSVT